MFQILYEKKNNMTGMNTKKNIDHLKMKVNQILTMKITRTELSLDKLYVITAIYTYINNY